MLMFGSWSPSRIILRIIAIVIAVLAVLVGTAYLLPREVTVARTVTIDADPGAIFPYINSLKATQQWSPWLERDPNVALTYTGPDAGVGASMVWSSDNPQVGEGSQKITTSVADERVETALDFGAMGTATAMFLLDAQGGATDVTWTLVTDMGNSPIRRWMGVMMDRWVGQDYENGLANLKYVVERNWVHSQSGMKRPPFSPPVA